MLLYNEMNKLKDKQNLKIQEKDAMINTLKDNIKEK